MAGRRRRPCRDGFRSLPKAAETGWSKFPVNRYASSIRRKLDCANGFEAAVRAMRLGLL